jgi:hypothetical protein
MFHDVERGRVDRQVDAEPLALARSEIAGQDLSVIVARDRQMHEFYAALVEQFPIGIVGADDDEMLLVIIEMALDQRQRALAD